MPFPSGLSVDTTAYRFERASGQQAVCKTQEVSNEDTTFGEVGAKVTCYAGDFIQANALSERVVKVSTEQPGFTFRLELVWAFVNFHALTVHIRNTTLTKHLY